MRFKTFRSQRYQWACRNTRVLPWSMWALLAVVPIWAALGKVFFAFWAGLLVLLLLWVFPLHWFSLRFRSLAWRISRSAGVVYRRMASRAAWLFLLFAGALLIRGWYGFGGWNWAKAYSEYSVAVLVSVLFLAVLFGMYRARRRIIIQPFLDFTVSGKDEGQGEAIASRLRTEMAAITGLYKVIDEMSSPGMKSVPEATVTVEDVGEVLKEAIGPDSKIQFRSLQIPLRAIVGPFAWLARGPRLTGSLHKDGDKLLLVAELQGGGLSGGWRVSSADTDDEGWDPDSPGWRQSVSVPSPDSCAVPNLTRQLAYRIVTDLVSLGSRRWRAVRQYTEGLRAYRDIRSTQRDDKLLQAERAFVRALGDDDKFGQCHYNLGVVYRDIGRFDSARAAFQRALQENPSSFAAAYAIAKEHFDRGRYEESVYWCDTAIRINADDARAWKLKGWAMRRREERKHGAPLLGENGAWPAIVEARDIAAALAWRTLCRRAAAQDPGGERTWIAAAATLNSGIGHALTGEPFRAKRRFRQSLGLAPDQPLLQFEVGKTWCQVGDWEQGRDHLSPLCWEELPPADQVALHLYRLSACDALRPAEAWTTADPELRSQQNRLLDLIVGLRDNRDSAERMSWLEDVEIVRNVQKELREQREGEGKDSFIDSVEIAWYLLAGMRRRGGEGAEACAARLAALDRSLEEQRSVGVVDPWALPGIGDHLSLAPEDAPAGRRENASARQRRLVGQAARGPLDLDWLRAQVKVRLAEERLNDEIVPVRRVLLAATTLPDLKEVIGYLERSGHELQVWKQGLYSLLAEAYLAVAAALGESTAERDNRPLLLNKAMKHAERAAAREPEGFRQRITLGRAHAALQDYMQAEHELTTSLQLRHTAQAAMALARVCSERGTCLAEEDTRKQDFGLARRTLDIALRMAEVGPEELNVQVHGRLHFLLGSVLGDPSTPISPVASRGSSSLRIESGSRCDNAAFHQKIARSMGYKPIESAVLLGWTYFEDGRYEQAGEMFREAFGTALSYLTPRCVLYGARGRHPAGRLPADAPGEEKPINELLARALLGRALACAGLGTQPTVSRLLGSRALKLIGRVESRALRRELRSQYRKHKARIERGGLPEAAGAPAWRAPAAAGVVH